ncbi:MAG: truA [Microbacteriaceae bacterium]|jgi:tRNA pseudouridine38-40 synthase|nr:truA [Microbacteriaceae bacterium]
MTCRLRLDIAYDGSGFSGWSRQPALRTVQGVLEAALATIFARSGPPPVLTVAGRTDAGVHALGQVAHLDLTDEQLDSLARRGDGGGAPALARRLNGIAGLDSDVWVSSVTLAPSGFDARFSAIWRRYEYRVADANGPRNPLERARTLWYPAPLDDQAMDVAASGLVGLHDWAAYCKPREGATTIRTLQDFRWTRADDGVLVASVKADAFCHSMVRALVGATVAVGEGKLAVADLVVLRDQLQRTSAYKVMPAKGLVLLQVGYPDDAGLAERALQTRARRDAV